MDVKFIGDLRQYLFQNYLVFCGIIYRHVNMAQEITALERKNLAFQRYLKCHTHTKKKRLTPNVCLNGDFMRFCLLCFI